MTERKSSALYRAAVVCDLTLPWTPDMIVNRATVLPRLADAGLTFVSTTLGTDWMTVEMTVIHIATEQAKIRSAPDRYVAVQTVADISRAKKEGKLAVGFHFQGTNPLGGRIAMVELYYRLGIRHMLLCYNQKNLVGDGCHERTDGGLSKFGIELVQEMNRVGMIVDCSHTGYRTSMEAMEVSTSPVIFSHSNARALVDHERNIRDDQAKACAKNGGIVGLNGMGIYIADNDASNEAMYRQYAYYADLIGPEHVALGLDFVFCPEDFYDAIRQYPNRFPGYPIPQEFYQPEQLEDFVDLLLRRGHSEAAVRGLLGENFLRVARRVWR